MTPPFLIHRICQECIYQWIDIENPNATTIRLCPRCRVQGAVITNYFKDAIADDFKILSWKTYAARRDVTTGIAIGRKA